MTKLVGKVIWGISEHAGLGLGRFAPVVLGWMIGRKPEKVKTND